MESKKDFFAGRKLKKPPKPQITVAREVNGQLVSIPVEFKKTPEGETAPFVHNQPLTGIEKETAEVALHGHSFAETRNQSVRQSNSFPKHKK